MLQRWITNTLQDIINHAPVVALLGARQVGKTTLAKQIAKQQDSIYLDLEDPRDLFKLNDPASFLAQNIGKLIILDEIQRAPDLFMVLRGIVDRNRAAGHTFAQFLLLGSASMDLLRQSSESLAGRISYLEMSGLNNLEVNHDPMTVKRLWLRGGFPDSYLAASDRYSVQWRENMIRTYLERDIPQVGFRVPAARLRRLWTMLAHLQGETINFSKIAANLEIDGKTVRHYIDILVDLLLVKKLDPWHANVKKRLIKSSRFYICDSGIVHRLLGIDDYDALLSNPVIGKSWEGFVVNNIHSILPNTVETYFYRTASGAEIDLLIRWSAKELWAIEIKYGVAPKLQKGFHQAAQDIQATRKYVVYGGDDAFSIGNEIIVISLRKFMEELIAFRQT